MNGLLNKVLRRMTLLRKRGRKVEEFQFLGFFDRETTRYVRYKNAAHDSEEAGTITFYLPKEQLKGQRPPHVIQVSVREHAPKVTKVS